VALAVFAAAASGAAWAGYDRLKRTGDADADAAALQQALLTARFVAYAAERMELKEIARLQKVVGATSGNAVREIAVVAEASDPRFPLLRGKRYVAHTDPARASTALSDADAGDALALEASRRVMDRAEANKPHVRMDFRAGTVTAGVAVMVRGTPEAAAIATVERAPREGFPAARPHALAAALAIAFFGVIALFLPLFGHVAAFAALAMLAGFTLAGREQVTDLALSRVAERAQFIASAHDRLSGSPEGAPDPATFLVRMQAGDPRPFTGMARVPAPSNAPGPVAQLRAGQSVTVPVQGLVASYRFTLPPGTAAEIVDEDRAGYTSYVGWTLAGAAALYLAAAVALARPWRRRGEEAP
jgi:hypothetical protein